MSIRYAPLAMACALMVAATAQAAPVTYAFGGTLDDVAWQLPLAVGNSFTGWFTFESTSLNLQPAGYEEAIYPAGFAINAAVNGYFFSSSSTPSDCPNCGTVSVFNGRSVDGFVASSGYRSPPVHGYAPLSGPKLDSRSAIFLLVDLIDFGHTAFSSVALPSNLALSSFEYHRFTIFFEDADGYLSSVSGPISSLSLVTVAPVPEASTNALLALGLGALGIAARRRKAA